MSSSFYRPADSADTIRYVDENVYATRYQQEKNRCIHRLLARISLQDRSVLEIGCGAGFWTDYLVKQGGCVTAVDVLPHLVGAAQTRLAQQGLADSARFFCGRLDEVVADDERFDVVFMKDVIEHVEDDAGLIASVKRHTTAGGLLFVATQNSLCLNFALEAFWERVIKRQSKWMGWDDTHHRFYTLRKLTRLLRENDFVVRHTNGAYFIPYRWFTGRLKIASCEPGWCHVLDRRSDDNWLARFGWSIHLLARRAGVTDRNACT